MARTAADVLVDCLLGWGVRVVFGFPATGTHGITEALDAVLLADGPALVEASQQPSNGDL